MTPSGPDRRRYRALVVLSGVAAAGAGAPPVAVLVGSLSGIGIPVATAATLALALPVGVVVAGRALAPSRPGSVGTGGTPVVLLGLPAIYGAVALGVATTGGSEALVLPMGVGSILGGSAALAAVAVAGGLRTDRARAESERVVAWRARPADRPSWWVRTLGIAGGVAVLAVGGLLAIRGAGPEVWVPVVAFGAVGTLVVRREARRRAYAAVDAGLIRARRLTPWRAFESYAVTDSAIVLVRPGLRADVRIDRADLADEAAVVAALDRHVSAREPESSAPSDAER